MKIIYWDTLQTEETIKLFQDICTGYNGSAITIGGFDGPHAGHESLFSAVLETGKADNLATGIVTFNRSPGVNKNPAHYPGDVSTLNLRLRYFAKKSFDFVLLIDFSGDFGKMSGGLFFDILVKTVRMRYVAVGPDFRCGHRLDTGIAELTALAQREGFRFDSIQQVELDGQRISSSAVRKAIKNADFAHAEKLLGHPFLLDFSISNWKRTGNNREIPVHSFTQILPRCGEYFVVLSVGLGKTVEAKLLITEKSVVLIPLADQVLPEASEITAARFRLS